MVRGSENSSRRNRRREEGGAAVTDTPRTDAAILDVLQSGQHYKVKADFARQLERELIAATETIKKLTHESHD